MYLCVYKKRENISIKPRFFEVNAEFVSSASNIVFSFSVFAHKIHESSFRIFFTETIIWRRHFHCPLVDPVLPLHDLWPQQCNILGSGVLPTKFGSYRAFLSLLIRHPGWPLRVLRHFGAKALLNKFANHWAFLSNLTPGWPSRPLFDLCQPQQCITLQSRGSSSQIRYIFVIAWLSSSFNLKFNKIIIVMSLFNGVSFCYKL